MAVGVRALWRVAPQHARVRRRAARAFAGEAEPVYDEGLADAALPWAVGLYHSKRPDHKTDAIGGLAEESLDNLADPVGWNSEGKLLLAKQIVARDLGVPVEALSRRLDALAVVLPELAARFDTMRAGDIARLAAVADPAASVVRLRTVFPAANVNRMIARRPELLLMDAGEVAERAVALRLLLPGIDADAAAAEQPRLLDVHATRAALAEMERLMPDADVVRMVGRDPSLISSVDTGDLLIPYDNGTLRQLQASLRGDADAAPEGW